MFKIVECKETSYGAVCVFENESPADGEKRYWIGQILKYRVPYAVQHKNYVEPKKELRHSSDSLSYIRSCLKNFGS